jgi:hypothetical protein
MPAISPDVIAVPVPTRSVVTTPRAVSPAMRSAAAPGSTPARAISRRSVSTSAMTASRIPVRPQMEIDMAEVTPLLDHSTHAHSDDTYSDYGLSPIFENEDIHPERDYDGNVTMRDPSLPPPHGQQGFPPSRVLSSSTVASSSAAGPVRNGGTGDTRRPQPIQRSASNLHSS